MTSTPNEDQKNHVALEDALETYPIISAPTDFSKSVINKVRLPEPKPQFRLSWIDYALTVFFTSMIYLLLFLWQLIPFTWIQAIRFQAFALKNRIYNVTDLSSILVGIFLFFFVVSVSSLLFRRPQSITTFQ